MIARSFDPAAIARTYDAAGADAISVLTERDHFLGELAYLERYARATTRPLLRKDFLLTRYQVAQSAAYGADCVLLIVAGMDDAALRECIAEARLYALDVLVEVHDERDLARAVDAGAMLLSASTTATCERSRPTSPSAITCCRKCRRSLRDQRERHARCVGRRSVARCRRRGFLIGEALMQAESPGSLIAALRDEAARRPGGMAAR